MYLSSDRVSLLIKNKEINIRPFLGSSLLETSYEIRLGNRFKSIDHIDDNQRENIGRGFKFCKGAFQLMPRSFVLALSNEKIGISNGFTAFIKAREELFNDNYSVHHADGFITNEEPEQITLNIFNSSSRPINLYPGMKIGEVVFAKKNNSSIMQ